MFRRALPLFLAACILAIAAVHEDRLTGDRQFWVTRPYLWKSLLLAKALFRGGHGKRGLIIAVDADYFDRVKDAPVRLHGSVDLTLVAESSDLASFGQCWSTTFGRVECLSPLPRARLTRVLADGSRGAMAGTEGYAPYPTSPWFGPLQKYVTQKISGDIGLVAEHPVAHIQRPFDFGPLRLADYQVVID
jgi:hypothetical protein